MLFPRCWALSGLIFRLLLLNCVESRQEILIEESAQEESFSAPTGGSVKLPCDVTPTQPGDRLGLLIWYKQGHNAPIYTLDTREDVSSHWSDPGLLGPRATFRSDPRPAVLILTNLRPEDSGQYRCRVDFIRSPTKNTRLNLTVLIPPDRLIILNHEGNEVRGGSVGPFNEGSEVNLTCIAIGGFPPARVSWWKSHSLLTSSEGNAAISFTLQRSDYGTDLTCQAVTDTSMSPISESVTIDINLPPLWIRLVGEKRPLIAGRSTELICQAIGARPKPLISWWMGNIRLKQLVRETTSLDGNMTSSVLTLVPTLADAGRVLSCKAEQSTSPHAGLQDSWQLEIQHYPIAKLEFGANLDPSKVVEGSDVYLDCTVLANPRHHLVFFTHNGVVVKSAATVLLSNQSLVLQRVSRQAAGAYVCSARNALGLGSSDKLMLDVKYAPTCSTNQPTVFRAAKGEVIEINCSLNANPKEPMSYHWRFNSSAHTKHELFSSSFDAAHNTLGTLLYTVNSSADYGWVQCSGTNSVGRQVTPCLHHVLPADKPSSVERCDIKNVTNDSLSLTCVPGHDGGITQTFLLQVFDMGNGNLLYNATNNDTKFEVSGLLTTSSLSVSVQAFNAKGSSEALTLTVSLLKYPERRTDAVAVQVRPVLLTALVSAVAGVAVAICATTIYCCRHKTTRNNNHEKQKRGKETTNIPLTEAKETYSENVLDKNPDLIPLDGKLNDTCSIKCSTTDCSSTRPLLTKSSRDKYGSKPPNCNDWCSYDPRIVQRDQHMQVRPPECIVRPTYHTSSVLLPTQNSCSSIQSLSNNSHMHNIQRPFTKVHEDLLMYKHYSPPNSNLLPANQLKPAALFLNSSPRPLHVQELDPRYQQSCRTQTDFRTLPHHFKPGIRSCSYSPPLRFNSDNSRVYFVKNSLCRTADTTPVLKTKNNDSTPNQTFVSKKEVSETKIGES